MISAETRLNRMQMRQAIPHALLFTGPKDSKLEEMAYDFASKVLLQYLPHATAQLKAKTHPDIHFFHPEGRTGMHSIEQIHKLTLEVSYNCSEAPLKFLIVNDAERCLPSSSNALLKTLEEPVSHSVILLLSTKPDKLLPTILSRCQRIVFEGSKTHARTDLQIRFLNLLTSPCSSDDLQTLVKEIENERKEWEKKMMKELPKELTLLTRERLEKEIEGQATLEFQEKAFSLLETFLLWARDVHLVKSGIETHLVYPEFLSQAKLSPSLSLVQVEKMVSQMRMMIERSTSLQTCLEALLMRFGYL
jgi:DNA polymerase-3 subunit delta'